MTANPPQHLALQSLPGHKQLESCAVKTLHTLLSNATGACTFRATSQKPAANSRCPARAGRPASADKRALQTVDSNQTAAPRHAHVYEAVGSFSPVCAAGTDPVCACSTTWSAWRLLLRSTCAPDLLNKQVGF